MPQNWRLRLAHLALDRQLSLHEDVGANGAHNGDYDGGAYENGREHNDSDHLQHHEHCDLDEELGGLGDSVIHCDGKSVAHTAADTKVTYTLECLPCNEQ